MPALVADVSAVDAAAVADVEVAVGARARAPELDVPSAAAAALCSEPEPEAAEPEHDPDSASLLAACASLCSSESGSEAQSERSELLSVRATPTLPVGTRTGEARANGGARGGTLALLPVLVLAAGPGGGCAGAVTLRSVCAACCATFEGFFVAVALAPLFTVALSGVPARRGGAVARCCASGLGDLGGAAVEGGGLDARV